MAQEIERKFLLCSDEWQAISYKKMLIRQGYLCNNEQASVRIRVEDNQANINIKSMNIGISRAEYEYSIPLNEALELLDTLCEKPQIEKHRYLANFAGKRWEIDVFTGENTGLTVAEVELLSEDEEITFPGWVGREVSHLERYYNMRLVKYPYSQWSSLEKNPD